jgi:hypothetical protein
VLQFSYYAVLQLMIGAGRRFGEDNRWAAVLIQTREAPSSNGETYAANATYLASLVLGAPLIIPLGIQASPIDDRDHDHCKRYYDREHRDYHYWDAREAAAYRHWLTEERREQKYRDYARLKHEEQAEYWRWRHAHPDWH